MARRGQYRFSDHYKIGKPQSELDFVDIPLDTDVSLYVDPYALTVSGDDWLRECGNLVVNFFDHFLTVIRHGNEARAMALMANLREPNDAHLGLSLGRPSGRGWGGKQGRMLYDTLRHSAAVKSGSLKDLSDIELLIPGIGGDKISDLAVNVIRGELVAYTEEQALLFNVPTERINSGRYWNPDAQNWTSRYANLPVYKNERLVLVPKAAVRVRLIPDYEEFYNRFVLDFLEAEHLKAKDSLVYLLKNGKRKVYRQDLKNKYKLSKGFLFEFTKQHPAVLNKYKKTLPPKAKPIDAQNIETRQRAPRPAVPENAMKLGDIPPGHENADRYHEAILGILTHIFYPWLTRPVKEQPVNEGRKRIDILFSNSAETGFFSQLAHIHKVFCPFINIECKNYSEDPKNPELDQLTGRFSRKRGNFGILVCRKIADRENLLKRLKDIANDKEGRVIVLDDSDVIGLLELKRSGKDSEISDFLADKLRDVLL